MLRQLVTGVDLNTRRRRVFADDRARILTLPDPLPEIGRDDADAGRLAGVVRLDTNRYSVRSDHAGHVRTLLVDDRVVRVVDAQARIKRKSLPSSRVPCAGRPLLTRSFRGSFVTAVLRRYRSWPDAMAAVGWERQYAHDHAAALANESAARGFVRSGARNHIDLRLAGMDGITRDVIG